jgi:hypothetical protein
MKTNQIISLLAVVVGLAACSDDPIEKQRNHEKGRIYFNLSEGRAWNEGSAGTRSTVEAPRELQCSVEGGQPIYLHTEIEVSSPVVAEDSSDTRGVRYKGDVFTLTSSEDKISSIGVYGKSSKGTIMNFVEVTPDGTDPSSSHDWYVKDTNLDGVWDEGTADFYGYAPFFGSNGSPTSSTNGLSVALNPSGVPVLTYEAPLDVSKQLDILTAKDTDVSKGDVELVFDHIMAAVKFKFARGKEYNGSTSSFEDKSTLIWNDGLKDYYVNVDKVELKGVY